MMHLHRNIIIHLAGSILIKNRPQKQFQALDKVGAGVKLQHHVFLFFHELFVMLFFIADLLIYYFHPQILNPGKVLAVKIQLYQVQSAPVH